MKRKRILVYSEVTETIAVLEKALTENDKFVYTGWFSNFDLLLSRINQNRPDILILNMPERMQPSAISLIRKCRRLVKVIVLSARVDRHSVRKAFKSGADGYLHEGIAYDELNDMLHQLAEDGVALSSTIARTIVTNFWRSKASPLTRTETNVLRYISEGHPYTHVARLLAISKETAKTHAKNIYRKLDVHRKSEALERAFNEQLI